MPQLQFDYGYMGDGGPLQIACFLVGVDTSSGAIHATMVPDTKKMDMPYVVAGTAKWVRDLVYEHTCLLGDKDPRHGKYMASCLMCSSRCCTEGCQRREGNDGDEAHHSVCGQVAHCSKCRITFLPSTVGPGGDVAKVIHAVCLISNFTGVAEVSPTE